MNPNRPLTAKQAAFVQHVVSGYSLADSYRLAYNSSGTSATVRVEASRLAKQPHIAAAIWNVRKREEWKRIRSSDTPVPELLAALYFSDLPQFRLAAGQKLLRKLKFL